MKRKFSTLLLTLFATSLAWSQPNISSVDTTDDYCQNGTITVNVVNGVEPYQYSLDGFTTVQSSPIFQENLEKIILKFLKEIKLKSK